MLNRILTITTFLFLSGLMSAQDCPVLNVNGNFEETIYVPGGEPAIGITTGQMSNWAASHGTADYLTKDWNWYDLEGLTSNAGHLCYGNRDAHDHSEGIYTSVDILGDDDLLYTLRVDYATVCDATENGYLNIALNNNLNSEGHNWFQYPTPTAFPEFFDEIQAVERFELTPEANYEQSGMSNMEVSFVAHGDFSQIWLFTEYQHDQVDFVNCGLLLDNIELTATTTALSQLNVTNVEGDIYKFSPEFSRELDIVSYNWMVDQTTVSNEETLIEDFEVGTYTICLDINDSRGACATACYELIVEEYIEEEIAEEIVSQVQIELEIDNEDDFDNTSDETNSSIVLIDSDDDNEVEEEADKIIDFFNPIVIGSTLEIKPLNASVELLGSKGAIFNSAGQLIMTLDDVNYFDKVNLDHLPVGVYILKIINKNRRQSKTFFKGDEVI